MNKQNVEVQGVEIPDWERKRMERENYFLQCEIDEVAADDIGF